MICVKIDTQLPPVPDTSDLTHLPWEAPEMHPVQAVPPLRLTTSKYPSNEHRFNVPIDKHAKQATA